MLSSHWPSLSTPTLLLGGQEPAVQERRVFTLSKYKKQSKMTQLPFRCDGELCGVSCSCSSACEAAERRPAQPPSTVLHLLKTSEWRKECCKEWRAWMSIWASSCLSMNPSTGHLPAGLTLRVSKRVSVWTQHYKGRWQSFFFFWGGGVQYNCWDTFQFRQQL